VVELIHRLVYDRAVFEFSPIIVLIFFDKVLGFKADVNIELFEQ